MALRNIMPRPVAGFDAAKAVAATGYLVEQTRESMYSIMKMLYLADKLHLERYGRFIAGESYSAMDQGPVPSCTYNLVKVIRGQLAGCQGEEVARDFLAYGSNHEIVLRKPVALDELSETDIECLAEVVHVWKKIGKWAVRDLSHDDAWKAAMNKRDANKKSCPMKIEDIARQVDSAELVSHVQDPNPGHA